MIIKGELVEGEGLCTRYPTIVPRNIIKIKAIKNASINKALKILGGTYYSGIIFPVDPRFPSPCLLQSGGHLDGDCYAVLMDPSLKPYLVQKQTYGPAYVSKATCKLENRNWFEKTNFHPLLVEAIYSRGQNRLKVSQSGKLRIIFSDRGEREKLQIAAKIHFKCLNSIELNENETKFFDTHKNEVWPEWYNSKSKIKHKTYMSKSIVAKISKIFREVSKMRRPKRLVQKHEYLSNQPLILNSSIKEKLTFLKNY